MPSPGLTAEQQLEYDVFIRNNPGDEGRASSALGFEVPAGTQVWSANDDAGNWDVAAARGEEAPGVREMIARDRGSWERSLREEAQRKGVTYDPTMLDDVIRAVSHSSNVGKDPGAFLQNAFRTIGERANNVPGGVLPPTTGGSGTSGGGGSGGPSLASGGAGSGGPGTSSFAAMADTASPVVGPAPAPIKPFTEQFSYADFVAPTPRAQDYPGYRPTTQDDLQADPSWKIRLKEAQDAIERSAAARGSYLTPNTMRDITRSSQDYASNEFSNVDTRRFRDWGTGYDRLVGEDMSAFDRAGTTYGMNRGNQKDIFDTRRSIFEANENNRYGSERSNRLDDFGILTGNRNYALGSRGLDLQALAGDRGYDLGLRGSDLANRQFTFASDLANRGFDFTRDQDAWMRNRSGYLDDFNIWRTRDRDYMDDLFRGGQLGRPD